MSKEKLISRRQFLDMSKNSIAFLLSNYLITKLSPPYNNEGEANPCWPIDIFGNETFLRGNIFITIDDCYDSDLLERLLNLLTEKEVKASFFPNSTYVQTNNESHVNLWRGIYENGHDIGYHTVSHTSGMNPNELEEDFRNFQETFKQIITDNTFEIKLVRPPGGNWNQDWLIWVRENNLTNVRWNYVPNNQSSETVIRATMNHPEGGGIILLHTRRFDVNWLQNNLDILIELAKEQGGLVTSIGEAINNNCLTDID